MPAPDEIQNAVNDWSSQVLPQLLRSLCPLYKRGVHGPELVGSGTMIRVSGIVFVATAAHVVEDLGSGERYIGVADQLRKIPRHSLVNNLGLAADRISDRFDAGCMVFDPKASESIPLSATLSITDLDIDSPTTIADDASYLLAGYPASRQPRKLLGDTLKAGIYPLLTTEHRMSEYGEITLNRNQNLFVSYEKAETFYDGWARPGPNLQGMSGGALWRLDGNSTVAYRSPHLGAIALSWRLKSGPKGVVALRMRHWLQLAARRFPALFARELELQSDDRAV